VQSVDYISRDQALATFQQNHADNPVISQVINTLDSNPLDASLNIKRKIRASTARSTIIKLAEHRSYIDSTITIEQEASPAWYDRGDMKRVAGS